MAEPSGKILIDNINIKNVSLHELRSVISEEMSKMYKKQLK